MSHKEELNKTRQIEVQICNSCNKPFSGRKRVEDRCICDGSGNFHYGVIDAEEINPSIPGVEWEKQAIAYSPEINVIRPILAKHLGEWKNEMLCDLASLLSSTLERYKGELEKKAKAVWQNGKENHLCRFNDGKQNCDCYYTGLSDIISLITETI